MRTVSFINRVEPSVCIFLLFLRKCFSSLCEWRCVTASKSSRSPFFPVKILFPHADDVDALAVSFFQIESCRPILQVRVQGTCKGVACLCTKGGKEGIGARRGVNKQLEFDLSIRTLENRAVARAIKWKTGSGTLEEKQKTLLFT